MSVCVRKSFFWITFGFADVILSLSLHGIEYMPAYEVVMLLVRFEMLLEFLMISDVVCIIGIPNLVNLSLRGFLRVLVGRKIGL